MADNKAQHNYVLSLLSHVSRAMHTNCTEGPFTKNVSSYGEGVGRI